MYRHTTDEVVMIRPKQFYMNEETAVNNAYQKRSDESIVNIQKKALKEFDDLASLLKSHGLKVHVLQDSETPSTPDSIFPNNWFSTHEGGLMSIYPMFATNRQAEVPKFIDEVTKISKEKTSSEFLRLYDYQPAIYDEKYLEGTGAIVIDRKVKVAYCVLSPRADKALFEQWCKDTRHTPVSFRAEQDGQAVYHTNVIMGIGERNAVICLDSIVDLDERKKVEESLKEAGNTVIDISLDQVKHFLGNNLELKGKNGNFLAMSKDAYDSLTPTQKETIEKETPIVYADISTIEYYGGGSVRCMIAEIFE
ncbi:MAG: arginine deiminase-related protein [Erysipelotrichales bacterium]